MHQRTIGIFHDDSLANELGKKATESDIVLFHRKTDHEIFTFVYPVEDKIIPKSQIMSMIDFAIISAEQITPNLGETILMLDSIGLKKGIILIPPYVETSQIKKMIQDTSLASFSFIDRDVHKIMEVLQNQNTIVNDASSVAVTIDHSFHVKGIGEVILGFVNHGTVKKHDTLMLYPSKKEVIVRSIQMQDTDVDSAPAGSRIGLALKGVEINDLSRGYILGNSEEINTISTCTLSLKKNPFYPNIKQGKFHATIGLQTVPITISDVNDSTISIETEKPIAYLSHQKFLFLDLNAEKLHLMGSGSNIKK
jgi:selenocysteine-specific translation elongation factor